jgi:hypothetical protein
MVGHKRTRGEGGSCSDPSGCGKPFRQVKEQSLLAGSLLDDLGELFTPICQKKRQHPKDAAAEDEVKSEPG